MNNLISNWKYNFDEKSRPNAKSYPANKAFETLESSRYCTQMRIRKRNPKASWSENALFGCARLTVPRFRTIQIRTP